MNVKELLRGIIVVVDDQIEEDASEISKILSTLKEDKFPVVTYEDVPDEEVIQSLSSASIVILDWEFKNRKTVGEMGNITIDEISRIKIGELSNPIISFIKILLDKIFVPIFIFTNKTTSEIETALEQDNLKEQIGKRILIKQKNDLEGEKLYTEIENWFKNNPSAYVVKEWDKIATRNRDNMFLDLYNSDADWVPILWKSLAEDSDNLNTHNELGDFITKNFCNRFHSYNFEEEYTQKTIENVGGLFKVLKHDAYIEYNPDKLPDIAYAGDVFKLKKDYYINLRAQCDISRKENEEYNPEIYCIKGHAITNNKIIRDHISFIKENDNKIKIVLGEDSTNDNTKKNCIYIVNDENNQIKIISSKDEPISIDNIDCDSLNKKIKNCIDYNFCFKYGALLENKDYVLFPYIIENKIIKFGINKIIIESFNEIKNNRIGRIVHPYLTRIQQKTANYITRQGLMPIPEEMYFI